MCSLESKTESSICGDRSQSLINCEEKLLLFLVLVLIVFMNREWAAVKFKYIFEVTEIGIRISIH